MAKKIRFPLIMEQGVEVRSVTELRENFSMERILLYVSNKKLIIWLRNMYEDEIADKIECLDVNDSELAKKLCEIFDVEYNESYEISIELAEEQNKKLKILKEHTTDVSIFEKVGIVAFNQDDLYDLLDKSEETIYLCGDKFTIPINKKGITYIGINEPIVVIDSNEVVDWDERKIVISGVRYNEEYSRILEEADKKTQYDNSNVSGYLSNSYLNFMLSPKDKENAKQCYDTLSRTIDNICYDADARTFEMKQKLKSAGLIGLAENHIENL